MPTPAPTPTTDKARTVGVARRLRGLARMGYNPYAVAEEYDVPASLVYDLLYGSRRGRHTDRHGVARPLPVTTWAAVAQAYDDLSMTPGPSPQAAEDARRRFWCAPLAWDDDGIDDPTATANSAGRDHTGRVPTNTYDHAAVWRRLNGDHDVKLRAEDLEEAVRRCHAAGMADSWVADLLGVWVESVQRVRVRLGLAANTPTTYADRVPSDLLNRAQGLARARERDADRDRAA